MSLDRTDNVEKCIIDIRAMCKILTNKDVNVIITYRGTEYGVSMPWNLKVEGRETNGESLPIAVHALYTMCKADLERTISSLQTQAEAHKKALSSLKFEDSGPAIVDKRAN